jgi:tRNA1Val (adenine37-N6)-methyltransferase
MMKKNEIFKFKKFEVSHKINAQKVSTDSVLLASWADLRNSKVILDIGTGCGVIALMLAQRSENATIFGIEIESSFADEANQNFKNSPFSDRLNLFNEDIRTFSRMNFDHIICNPPYFSNSLKSEYESRNLARHDLNLSFDELSESVFRLLNHGGRFSLVIPVLKKEQVVGIFEKKGFHLLRECHVKHHLFSPASIILLEFGFQFLERIESTELILKNESGHSEEYKKMMKEFLLIF